LKSTKAPDQLSAKATARTKQKMAEIRIVNRIGLPVK
jgi:hypothetical protein